MRKVADNKRGQHGKSGGRCLFFGVDGGGLEGFGVLLVLTALSLEWLLLEASDAKHFLFSPPQLVKIFPTKFSMLLEHYYILSFLNKS